MTDNVKKAKGTGAPPALLGKPRKVSRRAPGLGHRRYARFGNDPPPEDVCW